MEQAPGMTIGAAAPDTGVAAGAPARAGGNGQATQPPPAPPRPAAPGWHAAARAGRWPMHLVVLCCYLAAGVALTWPRASYLTGRLPGDLDQSSYVWDFWWIAHQVTHLGNPWFTASLAAPAGTRLGFDTLMPLPGLLMTPVTLAFGPSASYNLLAIVVPGLSCYLAYRAARLWLSTGTGAVISGALYGFAAVLVWQDWYHLNIALGALFFPLALEASVRLRRHPGPRRAVLLGLVLGAAFLVNQETAIMAAALAAAVLAGWLARSRSAAALRQSALAAGVAVLAASPQIAAMAQQALTGGAALPAALLAHQDTRYGVPLTSLFAPSPRTGYYGLHPVAAMFFYQTGKEGIPTFGVMLTLLALLGLVVAWRRPATRLFGLAWLACAVLALGSVLRIGNHRFVPLAVTTHYVQMSALLPYTWLIHVPGLSGLREPDRFLLAGLLPAALLAGLGVEWLLRRSPVLLAVVLTLAVLEAGDSGSPLVKSMATAIPRLDAPIAADHSGSIVVDIPFGLDGGLGAYGGEVSPHALVEATADGHPRAVSATSWEPATTVRDIKAHPFYRDLVAVQYGQAGQFTAAQIRAARQDALRMGTGWAIVWKPGTAGPAIAYLQQIGFTFVRQVHHAELFRLAPAAGGHTGSAG
jgi:hypothetical protein